MVKVAVVGLGFMGMTHLKAYAQLPNVRIVAACDPVRLPENGILQAVGGNIGTNDSIRLDPSAVFFTKNVDEAIRRPEVDLVDLCVPTSEHVRLSLAALQAGKHVICEKPLARTSPQARQIVEAAEAARTFFMPAMCMRFWPGWDWLKEAVADGRYGRVYAARFRRVASPPGWSRQTYFKGSDSGGALLDLHIHDVDFVQFCFGRPKSVFARGVTRFSGAIDHVVAQYDFGNDVAVHAEGSWILAEGHGLSVSYTMAFDRATIDYDLSRGADALRLFEEGQAPRSLAVAGPDGYTSELSYIVDCIENQRAPARVTARDALSAVEICEAEEESIRTGRMIDLPASPIR